MPQNRERSCSAVVVQRIKSLVAPGKPTEKSFAELVEIMSKHVHPVPCIRSMSSKLFSSDCDGLGRAVALVSNKGP